MASRPFLLWTLATSLAFGAQGALGALPLPAGYPLLHLGLAFLKGLLLGGAQSVCLRWAAPKAKRAHWFWITSGVWTASAAAWSFLLYIAAWTDSHVLAASLLLTLIQWALLGAAQAWLLQQRRSTRPRPSSWFGATFLGGLLGVAASSAFSLMAFQSLRAAGMQDQLSWMLLNVSSTALQGLMLGCLGAAVLLRTSLKDVFVGTRWTSILTAAVTVYAGLAVRALPVGGLGRTPAWYEAPESAWRLLVYAVSALALLASAWGPRRAWALAARIMGLFGLSTVMAMVVIEGPFREWDLFTLLPFAYASLAMGAATAVAWWPSRPPAPAVT